MGLKSGRSRKATIIDVAREAGVSIKTVSRVVNEEANVRQETRDRVREAVVKLDYEPSVSARGLAGRRSYSLCLMYEGNPSEFGYLKDVIKGAFDACAADGYSLLLRPCRYPDEAMVGEIRRFVTQTGVDGVILTPPICDAEGLSAVIKDLDIGAAQISPRSKIPGSSVVVCNDRQAMQQITDYVISLGHKRIGFVRGHPDHLASKERLSGYVDALRAHHLRWDASLVRQGYFDFDSGCRAARRLLALDSPPTAIISSNDDMAAGVMFVARELGLSLPADLSVTGFDDTPTASHIWPRLTTVKQPTADMAAAVARALIRRSRGIAAEETAEVFGCSLIIRESTAAPGQA